MDLIYITALLMIAIFLVANAVALYRIETFVYKSWDSVNTGVPVAGWKPPYLPQKI